MISDNKKEIFLRFLFDSLLQLQSLEGADDSKDINLVHIIILSRNAFMASSPWRVRGFWQRRVCNKLPKGRDLDFNEDSRRFFRGNHGNHPNNLNTENSQNANGLRGSMNPRARNSFNPSGRSIAVRRNETDERYYKMRKYQVLPRPNVIDAEHRRWDGGCAAAVNRQEVCLEVSDQSDPTAENPNPDIVCKVTHVAKDKFGRTVPVRKRRSSSRSSTDADSSSSSRSSYSSFSSRTSRSSRSRSRRRSLSRSRSRRRSLSHSRSPCRSLSRSRSRRRSVTRSRSRRRSVNTYSSRSRSRSSSLRKMLAEINDENAVKKGTQSTRPLSR